MRVRVIATPGHTWTHLAYVVTDARTGDVVGVFTGGSLLHGSTGRPDLLGARHAPTLAAAQHVSACRLAALLPGHTPVYPTHGPGSFCAARPTAGGPAPSSTIAAEARTNPVLTMYGDRYVATLLAGLDAFPAYYARMGRANTFGGTLPRCCRRRAYCPARSRGGSRPGTGWWTCGAAAPSPPGTYPVRSASRLAMRSLPIWAGCCPRVPG